MIVGDELQNWLASRERNARPGRRSTPSRHDGTTAASIAFRGRHGRPRATARRGRRGDGRQPVRRRWLGRRADRRPRRELRADPYFEPPFRAHQQRHPQRPGRLRGRPCLDRRRRQPRRPARRQEERASAARPRSASPARSPCSSSSRPAAPASPSGKRRAITADFTAADAGRCVRTGERRLADGDILVIDGRRQSFVIEHAAREPRHPAGDDEAGPGAAQRRI